MGVQMMKKKALFLLLLTAVLCACEKENVNDNTVTSKETTGKQPESTVTSITEIETTEEVKEPTDTEPTDTEPTDIEPTDTETSDSGEEPGVYYEKSWDKSKKNMMFKGSYTSELVFNDKVYEMSYLFYAGEDGADKIEGNLLGKIGFEYVDKYADVFEVKGYSPDYMVCVKERIDDPADRHYGEDVYYVFFRLNDIWISEGKDLFDLMMGEESSSIKIYPGCHGDNDVLLGELGGSEVMELIGIMNQSVPIESKEERHSLLESRMSIFSVPLYDLCLTDKNGVHQEIFIVDEDNDKGEVYIKIERMNDYDIILRSDGRLVDYLNEHCNKNE